MFFRSEDIERRQRKKNALRHKNTHYVIIDACSAYFMLNFFRSVQLRHLANKKISDDVTLRMFTPGQNVRK